jgi:hypothetical protein
MVKSQLFKSPFPKVILYDFLDKIALKTDKYYLINTISYKKALFKELINPFIEQCRPYYHNSKQKYLNKVTTYKSFITIIRQICNYQMITYTSQIKYDKSEYDILYYIDINKDTLA